MNCPKCGKEMGSGFLQTGNIIAFNKTFINIMFSLPSWKGLYTNFTKEIPLEKGKWQYNCSDIFQNGGNIKIVGTIKFAEVK